MPHTSHKKGNAQDKQRNVPGEDGWTYVVRGPPSRTLTRNDSTKGGYVDPYRAPSPGLTLERLQERSATIAEQWKDTAMYEHLEKFFERVILNEKNLRVTSCVCIGLGNFSTALGRPDTCLSQLAALESMLEFLRRKNAIEQVFVQDPNFNDLDKEFISSKGFILLEDNTAQLHLGPDTFVFAPFVPWPPLVGILEALIPLVVCNSLEHYMDIWHEQDRPNAKPGEKEVLMHFLRRRALHPLPDFTREREASFSGLDGLSVYWKDDDRD